jgi:hypothetical protein
MRTLRGQLNDYALPVFNMNGSSASALAEEYLAALHAVKAGRVYPSSMRTHDCSDSPRRGA